LCLGSDRHASTEDHADVAVVFIVITIRILAVMFSPTIVLSWCCCSYLIAGLLLLTLVDFAFFKVMPNHAVDLVLLLAICQALEWSLELLV
jgi:hypothetical protein